MAISRLFAIITNCEGGAEMLTIEAVEIAIMNLGNLRTAQSVVDSGLSGLVIDGTRAASDVLNELRDLMRREITIDLIFEKIVNPDR